MIKHPVAPHLFVEVVVVTVDVKYMQEEREDREIISQLFVVSRYLGTWTTSNKNRESTEKKTVLGRGFTGARERGKPFSFPIPAQ